MPKKRGGSSLDIGILDPLGKHPNPLTQEKYGDAYKDLAKKWSALPTYDKRHEILKLIDENRVILIRSGTGSGKSVLVPKLALHYYDYKEKLAMTLPKQVIAKTAAEYAAATMDVPLGSYIGYKYKGSPSESMSDKTLLLYATDGTIVNKLLKNQELPEYKCIIIDEAHERKVQIDFLLYLLKTTLALRKDFKLIIMSATIDDSIFRNYFNEFKFGMIDISSKSNYEVKSIFSDNDVKNYVSESVNILRDKIIKQDKKGDVLIFVTSVRETKDICKQISSDANMAEVLCVELYSGSKNQEMATDKNLYKQTHTDKKRKVVVATEVAESSLTIDGIVFVIDCGKSLQDKYDPVTRCNILNREFISQAQIKQRQGRAGRTEPGVCYHLYTKSKFDSLLAYPLPEIRRTNIYEEMLKLLAIPTINNVVNLKKVLDRFVETPKIEFINSGLDQLQELRIIDNIDNSLAITQLGKLCSQMKTGLPFSIALIYAYHCHLSSYMCKIVALFEITKFVPSSIFHSNRKLEQQINAVKKQFQNKYGDFVAYLTIIQMAEKAHADGTLNTWCKNHFIHENLIHKILNETGKMRANLHDIKHEIAELNLGVKQKYLFTEDRLSTMSAHKQKSTIMKTLLKCLFEGFKNHQAKLKSNNKTYIIPYTSAPTEADMNTLCAPLPKKAFYGEYNLIMNNHKLISVNKYYKFKL